MKQRSEPVSQPMKTIWTKPLSAKRSWDWLLLVLFITGGTFLRVFHLSTASFWVDEVNVVYAAQSMVENGTRSLPSGMEYTRAPLYTMATALSYRLLGVNEATSRLPAAFFGVLCIPVAYFFARWIFNRHVGLLTAFLIAFSHFEIGWSRVARMYTLLQLVSMLAVFACIQCFSVWDDPKTRLGWKNRFGSILWLGAAFLLLAVSTLYVHLLTLFLICGLFLYLVLRSISSAANEKGKERFLNPYAVSVILSLAGAALLWFGLPGLRAMSDNFLTYTPAWASGPASAQDRMVLFDFLIAPARFPLAVFFFVGAVHMVARRHRWAWILFMAFFIPIVLLSGLFTHRVPTYLFHVYPFFLMLASYGFINIVDDERARLIREPVFRRTRLNQAIVLLFFAIFIISPWLRISLHIPFLEDGKTNLAVTPDEWREACTRVGDQKRDGDLILASLPQVSSYYGIDADYGLNWSNLAQAKRMDFRKDGRYADVYAGVVCIESVQALDSLMKSNERGWLLVSAYHKDHENYMPGEVRTYLEEQLGPPETTKNRTVLIYFWDRPRPSHIKPLPRKSSVVVPISGQEGKHRGSACA